MQPAAGLVLLNGKVWTGNTAHPVAEAVACRAGWIVAVGSTAEVRKWVAPATAVIDLQGRLVTPGFNDAHVHFHQGGRNLAGVQLRDARSEHEFRERLGEFAARTAAGRWITGGRWDHENWRPAELPARRWIDAQTPGHPVFVSRHDGHMALANTRALELAGIRHGTPDPPGGAIVRDAQGELTGILKDAAMEAVARVIPAPSEDEIADAIRAAMRHAARNGVTSVQDMSASPEILRVYQRLLERGELTVRIYGAQPLAEWRKQAALGLGAAFGGDKLKIGLLKGFADGSLGSGTALFFEPYDDAPGNTGLASPEMIPESRMREAIAGARQAGLQVAVHAIGDKANHLILGMFEEPGRRFRIEHAQHLRAEDMARFGRLGVIASMQPYHLIDDGRWAEKRIGRERVKGAYAFRTLADGGAVLAFGSDWDVAPMDPLMGIFAAATRRTLDGRHPDGWIPEQKIRVAEALRAYTWGGAYASFEEQAKGTIEAGKLADLVVFSADILNIDPAEIEKTQVDLTVFDGRVVWERRRRTTS